MRKSQMSSGLRGFGGAENIIVPPAQQAFETTYSPDLDPQLAAMLDPKEYTALVEHRMALDGMKSKKYTNHDQVQANAIQRAHLKALQRRESQQQSQMGRRRRQANNNALAVAPPQPDPKAESFVGGRATSLQQQRDGRSRQSTGRLPIAPPAEVEVKQNLLNGTTWGAAVRERGSEPLVSASVGVNLRPEDPVQRSSEVVARQSLTVGELPQDLLSVEVPTPKRTEKSEDLQKTSKTKK